MQKYPPRRWYLVKSSSGRAEAANLAHIRCRGGSASTKVFGGLVFFQRMTLPVLPPKTALSFSYPYLCLYFKRYAVKKGLLGHFFEPALCESSQTGHALRFSENNELLFSQILHFLEARIRLGEGVSDEEVGFGEGSSPKVPGRNDRFRKQPFLSPRTCYPSIPLEFCLPLGAISGDFLRRFSPRITKLAVE